MSAEIEQLKREKEKLLRVLQDHSFTCVRAVTPSPSYDDNSTFFNGPYTCPTPGMPNEGPYPQRDTATPMDDPFDTDYMPINQEHDFLMYPGIPTSHDMKSFPTCTAAADDLPELQITDDFQDFEPISPDVALGRQSISEFPFDEDSFKIV